MATQNLKNQIARASESKAQPQKKSIKELIKVMEPQIKVALPSVITPERS
jgi:hypothetical protein